jgi:hypothetical protein
VATNPYLNFFSESEDQSLLDDLTVETIQSYGFDCVYIPRTLVNEDLLYSQDAISRFASGITLEMYIEDTGGFTGSGDLLSKFGLDIQDNLTLRISRTRFEAEVTNTISTIVRPREGDLVYMPAPFGKLWEIKFVEHEQPFYPLGTKYVYKLNLEKFRYSHERLQTGIPAIDQIPGQYGYAVELPMAAGGGGLFTQNEVAYQGSYPNATIATGVVVSWDIMSNILKLKDITGTFTTTDRVIGVSSGATWTPLSVTPNDNVNDAIQDNPFVDDQKNDIIDFSEDNPFSE